MLRRIKAMKKASQILLLIGMILSFVLAAIYLFAGIAFIIVGLPFMQPYYVEALEAGKIDTSFVGTPEECALYIRIVFLVIGGIFIPWTAMAIANGVIAALGRKKQTKVFYILNIVFGLLSGAEVNAVGGVFGLFTLPKRE